MKKSLFYEFIIGILLFPSFSLASLVDYQDIFKEVNQERTKVGISEVISDKVLNRVAEEHLQDMIKYDYWAHTNPVTSQKFYSYFSVRNSPEQYKYIGEILARNFPTSESLVAGWMNSPTHKAVILNSNYKKTGVAISNGVVVQVFSN